MKYHAQNCFLRASCSYTNHYGSWLSQQVHRGKIRGDSSGTHKVSDDIIAMSSFNYQIFSCEICASLNCLMCGRDTSVTQLKPMRWVRTFISCKPEAPSAVSWAVRWLTIMTFQTILSFHSQLENTADSQARLKAHPAAKESIVSHYVFLTHQL